MVICHRVCDCHHEHLEEEERLTTVVTTTGILAQGEGCHYDTTTGSTAMVTTMQDRLQERLPTKRPTTSLDYVIRLTDRLRMLRSKIYTFFSHGSRAGTTTRRDLTTTRVAAAACNGTDYNNCDVSTTATSTTGSDTDSTTSADTDLHPDVGCSWQSSTTTATSCTWRCSSTSSSRSSSSWTTTSPATPSSFTTTYCVRWYYTTISRVDTRDSQLPEHHYKMSPIPQEKVDDDETFWTTVKMDKQNYVVN